MQVDPVKPTLRPPGTKRLKLKCDEVLSNLAFNFNLRHYILVENGTFHMAAQHAGYGLNTKAGAYTRPLLSST